MNITNRNTAKTFNSWLKRIEIYIRTDQTIQPHKWKRLKHLRENFAPFVDSFLITLVFNAVSIIVLWGVWVLI